MIGFLLFICAVWALIGLKVNDDEKGFDEYSPHKLMLRFLFTGGPFLLGFLFLLVIIGFVCCVVGSFFSWILKPDRG